MVTQVSGLNQELWTQGKIKVIINGLKGKEAFQKSYNIFLNAYPFRRSIFVSQVIEASEFPPDYYAASIQLVDQNDRILAKTKANFIVSPMKARKPLISEVSA